MRQTDVLSWLVSAKNTINKVVGVIIGITLIIGLFAGGYYYLFPIIALGLFLLINSITIVSPGNRGFRVTLGYISPKSQTPGICWLWPFISTITQVDVRLQKHEDTNVMKTKNLRDITLKYVLTYQVNEDYVPWLHTAFGEDNYIEKALCPWLDAVFTEVIAEKTYEDINGHLGELSREIEEKYLKKVEERCYDYTQKYKGAVHRVHSNPQGSSNVPVRLEPGVNLFSNMAVAIIDVKFDDEYTKTVSELASVEKRKEIVEKKAEQLIISQKAAAEAKKIEAAAEADALKMKAAAEAEAMKLKGASENEVRERLGEILKANPELIKEVLAKNFPKVYGGGATPLINLDELLGEKK